MMGLFFIAHIMNQEAGKRTILDFLEKHTLAVLATVNQHGKPEAAVLEFSQTDKLEIVFDTFATYRKYQNLSLNSHVAFVIGWDQDITVQYEGVAEEVSNNDLKKYQSIHIEKIPHAAKFTAMEQIRYFKVAPQWIRYSNVGVHPWEVFELTF